MDNLILLCGEHHRLVHDDGNPEQFTIEALGRQRFRFRSADGHVIAPAPAPTPSAIAEQIDDAYAHIADDAIIPHWHGDGVDRDWFIHTYATKRSDELEQDELKQAKRARDDSAESSAIAA